MRLTLVGYGVVGEAFTQTIIARKEWLAKNYGLYPSIVAVVDRGGAAVDPRGLNLERLKQVKAARKTVAADPLSGRLGLAALEVIKSVEAEVLVEATPTNVRDGEPGFSHIRSALRMGRHVITTNKGPLALALPALNELARFNKAYLRFSGTVGGGTPILDFAKKCLLGDRILSIRGILNGTTNYILSKMTEAGVPFSEALAEAQHAGYAEADPSMDVDGWDAACKLVIMANHILNRRVTLKDVRVQGIRDVTQTWLREAAGRGCAVKLIGFIDDDGVRVLPTEVSKLSPLCVSGSLNAVTFVSEYAGEETIVGRGAGGMETASAMLRDLIDVKQALMERG